MRKSGRYDASDSSEAQYEPGSSGEVLRNRLGIKSKKKMDDVEAKALEKTLDELVRTISDRHRFTASDICKFHKAWLGDIYEWAGVYQGNGRITRVLSSLMALQAGLPLLDFSLIAEQKKTEYFAAVQAGLDKNYRMMEKLLAEIIERSFAAS